MAGGKETFGGHDCEFVEPLPIDFQTACPICHLLLNDPYQSSCGANFCHSCIQKVQAVNKPCPTCRKDNFELFQNIDLEHSLKQLYVKCTHSEDGCKWRGKLGKLEHHLREGDHSGELFSVMLELNKGINVNGLGKGVSWVYTLSSKLRSKFIYNHLYIECALIRNACLRQVVNFMITCACFILIHTYL